MNRLVIVRQRPRLSHSLSNNGPVIVPQPDTALNDGV
jgi:hypothetical protein